MRSSAVTPILLIAFLGMGCSTPGFRARRVVPPTEEVRRITVTKLDGDGPPSSRPLVIEDRARIAEIRDLLSKNSMLRTAPLGMIPTSRYGVILEGEQGKIFDCQVGGNWIKVSSGGNEHLLRMNLPGMVALRRLLRPPPDDRSVSPGGSN